MHTLNIRAHARLSFVYRRRNKATSRQVDETKDSSLVDVSGKTEPDRVSMKEVEERVAAAESGEEKMPVD